MSMKDKADSIYYGIASKLINIMHKIIKKNVDVGYLQKKYKATRGMIMEIHVTHTPRIGEKPVMEIHRFFKIENGEAVMLDEAEPNAIIHCELDTMLNMIKGEVIRKYEGRTWKERYDPLTAWSEGRLTIESPGRSESGWLSDLELLSREIYGQIFPIIKRELGAKIP